MREKFYPSRNLCTYISSSHTRALYAGDYDIIWYIDSTCSKHMTGRLEFLQDYKHIHGVGFVPFRNNRSRQIMGFGVILNGNLTIPRVVYINRLKHNLVSIVMLYRLNYFIGFDNTFTYIIRGKEKCYLKSVSFVKCSL